MNIYQFLGWHIDMQMETLPSLVKDRDNSSVMIYKIHFSDH